MRLDGTVIVVTGASGGLGRAIAAAFVADGARVVCSSRSESRLAGAVDSMTGVGEAAAVAADIRSREDVERLVEAAKETFGPIEVLVNNAGVNQQTVTGDPERKPVSDLPVDAWDAVLGTNLRGTFLCTRAVLPGMLDRDEGLLVHASSSMGSRGRARRAPYVASKFGIEGLHETLALEFEGTGVASTTFRPPRGGVFTESRGEMGMTRDDYEHDADVVAEPAVQLVADGGRNGGRYVAAADGESYAEYERLDVSN